MPCIQMENPVQFQEVEPLNEDESLQADSTRKSPLQAFVSSVHIPLLMGQSTAGDVIRSIVLFGTIAVTFVFAGMIPALSIGLEQQVALPRDSYLQDFFNDGLDLLRVGPPVMFVVKDMNVSKTSTDVNNVCATSGCNPDSLVSKVSSSNAQQFYIPKMKMTLTYL